MNRDIYELIEKMIDKKVKGADTYINNGSRWLIFTDEKKWIFELSKEGTLWYNYYFFQKIFKLISLDVVENQHHITKWVENFIQNGVKHTDACQIGTSTYIEDAIQNGVKHTSFCTSLCAVSVENTIQNGIKETKHNTFEDGLAMEDAIQNGVKQINKSLRVDGSCVIEDIIRDGLKHTQAVYGHLEVDVEGTIQNGVKKIEGISDFSLSSEIFKVRCNQTIRDGVKRTELGGKDRKIDEIKDIVENGIKETNLEEHHRLREVVQTVKNGIKETTPGGYLGSVEMKGKTVHQFEHSKQDNDVENVIESGIKATESIASHRTWMSEEVINNGIKETVCGVLQTYNPMNFEPVTKEMKRMNEVNIVLEKGIKEVKELPDKSGKLRGYGDYYSRQEDRTKPHTQYVDDVVRDGIKETKYCELHSLMMADHIIRDGIKETWGYEKQPQVRVNEVINKGEKTIWNNDPTEL